MIDKLQTRVALDAEDRAAILGLRVTRRSYEAPAYLVREGTTAIRHCSYLLSGFAFRQKLTANGARQIVSIHIAGDFIDLSTSSSIAPITMFRR